MSQSFLASSSVQEFDLSILACWVANMLLGGQTRQAQFGCMHALLSPGPQQTLCTNPSYHGAGPQREAVGAGLAFQYGKLLVSLHSMPLCAGNISIRGRAVACGKCSGTAIAAGQQCIFRTG